MLLSVREYAAAQGVSASTIQRRLQRGELKGKRFGRAWYVQVSSVATSSEAAPETSTPLPLLGAEQMQHSPTLKELIAFSSKALNSYLLMSDRLVAEKERSFEEMQQQLNAEKQRVAELTNYVRILENLVFGKGENKTGRLQLPGVTV